MAQRRVTMQDIADACGFSRNTVSKVFNGRGFVQEETRRIVLAKARELGYNVMPVEALESASEIVDDKTAPMQSIAVISRSNPLNHSFGSLFIKFFTDQICRNGFTVQLYEISEEEMRGCKLPPHISTATSAGILLIELFDRKYIDMICDMGLPVLVVDGYPDVNRTIYKCDYLSMENVATSRELTKEVIRCGAKTIGFVGDIEHCNSFHERWTGFTEAMEEAGLPVNRELCIIEPDECPYWNRDWTIEQLQKMPFIPDAFVCANDYHAIKLMTALKHMNIRIPEDVMLTGFDNSVESTIVDPSLTTSFVPAKEMGILAADVMLRRINMPDMPYYFTRIQTSPLIRKSTR